MRGKTACFTGHRKIPPESIPELSQRLKNTLLRLIEEGYMYFGAGGALGFDTLAAQCVLSLKKQYPHIKLILVLPCITQTKGWSKDDIAVYEEIKSQADKVVYLSLIHISEPTRLGMISYAVFCLKKKKKKKKK